MATSSVISGSVQGVEQLLMKLDDRQSLIGVIGLGYVGLPLAISAARAGFNVVGFDTDPQKPSRLNSGDSYIEAVLSKELAQHVAAGRFLATDQFDRLSDMDVIVICVPTPLSPHRDPDLSFVMSTAERIAVSLRAGQLVSLESTTFPGTTDEIVRPILEQAGLLSGRDFFLAYSPEREDPGSKTHRTATIPKVVAGDGVDASRLAERFYGAIVDRIVPVSSTPAAEAVKITENVFRSVNIALVNELKTVYDAMGVDIWEVIDAAATKPFGFMPFYPGPGLGGHCIPIDPFYLTWKAREYGIATRFIELAGEVNLSMPGYVLARLERALDETYRISLGAAKILIIGMAYKPNVSDVRESPAFELIERLLERGADVNYHDPLVPSVPLTRKHGELAGLQSLPLTRDTLTDADAVLVVTDHDAIDYHLLGANAGLIVDTRNALRKRAVNVSGALYLA